ncbi:prolipoprotein diacylglyceryl transferase [Nakamurella silvestris]|nr:prolipoprotein diacylglyceryl transferase [Nakamurella silvestris]
MPSYLASIPSPPQGVWDLGPFPVRAYAVFIIVGIVVAVVWGNKRWEARGGRPGMVTDIAVYAVPFGIVGGRLYHVITDANLYFGEGKNPWNAFAIWNGGLGIWGAVALGAVGALIACRKYGVPLGAFADAIAPGLVTAQAIGRLGNYFNQELFGSATTLPWGLDVFVRTPGGVAGIPGADYGTCEFSPDYIKAVPEMLCGTFHPTFLYELLWNLLVAGLVVWADRRFRLGGGRAFALYVAGYTLGRVWIESLRIDPATHVFGLRINVLTSIVVFIGAVLFLLLRRVPREDPVLLLGKAGRAEAAAALAAADATDQDGAPGVTFDEDPVDIDTETISHSGNTTDSAASPAPDLRKAEDAVSSPTTGAEDEPHTKQT